MATLAMIRSRRVIRSALNPVLQILEEWNEAVPESLYVRLERLWCDPNRVRVPDRPFQLAVVLAEFSCNALHSLKCRASLAVYR